MSEVKVFALINNMELIGKVKSETETTFGLTNALALHVQPGNSQEEAARVQLIPPTFFSNAEGQGAKGVDIILYKSNILFTYPMREDMLAQYNTRTSTIVLPNAVPGPRR